MDRPLTDGSRWWVSGNRWDLAAAQATAAAPDDVAVIVPYFEQPDSLARLYAAVAASRLPETCELLVVDDGSSSPPPPPPASLRIPVRHLRQADRGCRPGAARNLGAAHTNASTLVFLDADTLPEPDTITRLACWPHTIPDALVVGRRRHADLAGWNAGDTAAWLRGERSGPPVGADPRWLADGYTTTRNLLDADRRSYRYVISATMACSSSLFADIGGFDEERDEYGGEDWELAHRAWLNGAVLVHEPSATTWHDEPDWAERSGNRGDKNHETMWLSGRISEPRTRGAGIRHAHADIDIALELPSSTTDGQYVATIDSLLVALPDARIRLGGNASARVLAHVRHDPRVVAGDPPVERTCSVVLRQYRSGWWDLASLRHLLDEHGQSTDTIVDIRRGDVVVAVLEPQRAAGRLRRARALGLAAHHLHELVSPKVIDAATAGLRPYDDDIDLAAELGGWSPRRLREHATRAQPRMPAHRWTVDQHVRDDAESVFVPAEQLASADLGDAVEFRTDEPSAHAGIVHQFVHDAERGDYFIVRLVD